MPVFEYDFDPADHLTTDAIGPPGHRTFFFQAGRGVEYVSMVCEKEQMRALGEALLSLLDQIADVFHRETLPDPDIDMDLIEPVIPVWRIGQMGAGYDDARDRIILLVQELVEEGEEPAVARFIITREQARAFAYHALRVVEAGRPICPFCGEPIDPEGHSCFGSNGHSKQYMQ